MGPSPAVNHCWARLCPKNGPRNNRRSLYHPRSCQKRTLLKLTCYGRRNHAPPAVLG
ncbi:hypothetical protein O23A_p3532 [Aeromonas salmonicida]|nr:hypothetical protein O23A_p3532 [Aeromonas salmonicida]